MHVERCGGDVRLKPGGTPNGSIRPPGSKSLTNRHLLCAALADGDSTLSGASLSDDALAMIDGLRRLGVAIDLGPENERLTVRGGHGHLPAGEAEIDVGHAGTAMRFLAALCCLGHGRYRLDGSPRMRQRPIGPLVDALRAIGAGIGYDGEPGFPPLTFVADGLAGGEVAFRTPPSSQFLSALLMVAPYAANDVLIAIDGALPSRPYLDMTIAVMQSLAVETLVSDDGSRIIVPAGQRYRPDEYAIEPDASGATYFWAAAAITGGRICVEGLARTSLQGDVSFVDVLERMGCRVESGASSLTVLGPPIGQLRGVEVDLNAMPDTVQTLAVAALFARGSTKITNVANLRLKETDRLAALARELTKLGAKVEVYGSGLTIEPPETVRSGVTIDTYDDHRMAMSFALAGLRTDEIVIRDADCVSKSFPGYFDSLASLSTRKGAKPAKE